MTSFTKNNTAKNKANGKILLGYFWRESNLGKNKPLFTSFNGWMNYLEINYPSYLAYLGELYTGGSISGSKLESAMMKAGKNKTDLAYPRASDIQMILAPLVTFNSVSSAVNAVGSGIAETASEIGFGLKIGAIILLVAGAVYVAYNFQTIKKAFT